MRPIRVRQTGAKCAQRETEPSSESDSDWQSCTAWAPRGEPIFLDLSQQKGRHSLPSSNLRLMAVRRVPHLPHVKISRLLCAVTGPVG